MLKIRKLLGLVGIGALVFQLGAPIAQATHNAGLVHVTSSNISVQDITRTTATVCLTLSGSGNAKIYYGLTTAYGQSFQEEATSSCGKILRLTGLTVGTTYNFKIVSWPTSSTELQDGESSSNQTFTTLPPDTIAPGTVADGKINLGNSATSTTTYNSVTFNWIVPGDDGWNAGPGPARYIVKFQKRTETLFNGPLDGGTWNSAQNVAVGNLTYAPTIATQQKGATQSLTISGLEANTQYRFGVLSVDAVGNESVIPGIWDLNTTAAPGSSDTFAPPPVTSLSASSTTQNSITITWIAPWDPGINSVPQAASRYEIRYQQPTISTETQWQAATLAPNSPAPKSGGQRETFTVSGLSPATTYNIAVRAFDAAGNFSSLVVMQAATLSAPAVDTTPPKLSNIKADFVTRNYVDIAFTLDEDSTVRIEYSVPGGILLSKEASITGASSLASSKISLLNLLPGTRYEYKLTARNSVNLSSTESGLSFTTLSENATSTPVTVSSNTPSTPAPVISLTKTTNIYSNGADISFNTDISAVGRIEYGTSMSYGSFSQWTTATSTSHSVSLTGLTPDTIYYARLQANNNSGVGASAMPTLSFKTLPAGQALAPVHITSAQPAPASIPATPQSTTAPAAVNKTQIESTNLIASIKNLGGKPIAEITVGLVQKIGDTYRWVYGITNSAGEYAFPTPSSGKYELDLAPQAYEAAMNQIATLSKVTTSPAPKAPKVSLKIQAKGVTFSWDLGKDKKNIKFVKIYRSETKGVLGKVILNNIKRSSATDARIKSDKQYFYTVRTVDIYGNESINTKQVAVTTL